MGNDQELRYESATCIAAMFYTLRGIPFIYQGQEFGTALPNYNSLEDFDDIEGINKYHEDLPIFGQEKAMERINFGSRDGFRRPMCWSGEAYGGFSTVKPWISTHSRYQEVNLEADKASEKSVFRFFQNLLKLRTSTPAILYGTLNVVNKPEDPFFVFEREYEGEKYTVICNFEQESKISVPENTEVVLQNYLDRAETFRPYEILVVKHN